MQSMTTPAGVKAIWVTVEGTEQAHPSEYFFAATRDHAYCIQYLNRDESANLAAFTQLCFGFLAAEKNRAKAPAGEPVGPAVKVRQTRVSQCGPVVDSCNCAGNNPYPCCWNGGNCTWGAWDRMCCNWGYAAPGTWGNAGHVWIQRLGSVAAASVSTRGSPSF